MADTLDQSSIDALLATVGQDSPAAPAAEATKIFSKARKDGVKPEVRPYDFKRPERVSKDQMRALQTLHEAFARNFGASLSGFLRTIIEVKVATCEQMTYSEFISGLPNPTSFNLIEADGLEGQMCLEISPLIIYPIVDRLLGGTSQDLFIPQRPMTLIESRLIGNVTKRGLSALSEAWSGVKKFEYSIAATESNPQLVQIVPPNEVVVVVGFELKMGTRAGTMNLCIPYNVIEPVMDLLANQSWFSSKHSAGRSEEDVTRTLGRAALTLRGVLAETTITLEDLVKMSPGDVIVTERDSSKPAVMTIEGEKKFWVEVGKFGSQRALRVVRSVGPLEVE
jgi:flagellar motor switch protein FliM